MEISTFGEHRLKSGLAKRVSFRTGAIRVAPLRIYGIRSSYLTFNVLIGFTSRRLLKKRVWPLPRWCTGG